ncbi:chromosomal replication initiator protein DnaA [Solicola sp. PLA-1-18]|uniref:chromosomal replication initiator protein DnaA n=1 Tax=Solicola sp. PLA-1-18 TaxID=3380532 RepID=UPI003B7C1FED
MSDPTQDGRDGHHDTDPGTDPELAQAWLEITETLPAGSRAWVSTARPLTLHGSTLIVAVPNDFTRAQLETRLRSQLEDAFSDRLKRSINLAVTIDAHLDLDLPRADAVDRRDLGHRTDGGGESGPAPLPAPDAERVGAPGERRDGGYTERTFDDSRRLDDLSTNRYADGNGGDSQPGGGRHIGDPAVFGNEASTAFSPTAPQGATRPPNSVADARLNPRYLFETFVIGSSNRFAHAAAVAVAEAPGRAYNPLMIYGDSGLGKTHLLHAIGHYVRSLYAGARVRYVSSEEFTNDFINAIRDDRAAGFQRRYREVDVLLIDDIQFLEGKIQTQEEFFHTFNTLHNANKQIVITSDRPPRGFEQLEDRLRSRFEWGLTTDVQPPDLETRIAILRKKATLEKLTAPDDVLSFIASKIQTNIRELEGALIRATAFASLNHQPVDLQLAEIVLKDLLPEGGEPEITAAMIIAQTSAYSEYSIDDLCGTNRSRGLVQARQIAMYLCRELTEMSLPKIGQQFGGRDHTTVMHAERKIRTLMAERRNVFNQVTELTNRIKQQARQGR